MYQKRVAPEYQSSPDKRLRSELVDLFLSNAASSSRVSRLAQAAHEAGVVGMEELAQRTREDSTNKARDITRMAHRYKKWPKLYETTVRGRTVAKEEAIDCRCSMLLPHEFVYVVCQQNDVSTVLQTQEALLAKRPDLKPHHVEDTLWLGLWQDGVPFNANREHSLECWSLSLLACEGLRIPLTAWPRDLQLKRTTCEDYIAILKWSMECLDRNEMPVTQHDGLAFGPSDGWRKARAGKVIGVRGRLVELRGDWSMFKQVLGLPGWQETGPCCWKCGTTRTSLQEVGLDAAWRREKLSHADFLQRQADHAKWTSTFFDIPHVTMDTIKIDWLHAADLGVITDFLGNFFWYLTMFKVNGGIRHGTHQQRCEDFFNTDIKAYYERERIDDRIPCLRPTMLKKDGGSYKLRAKGGETRGLTGVIRELVEKYLDGGVPLERAMGHTGQQVVKMYACLSRHNWCPVKFETASIAFLNGMVWLERYHQRQNDHTSWRLKPKSHLLLELAREGTNPSLTWCYRDESWGGEVAELARRSGGAFTILAVSRQMLLRFLARESFPNL